MTTFGLGAYVEAHAEAFDAILPGLGDILRDLWREIVDMVRRKQAGMSGAAHELEFYGGER